MLQFLHLGKEKTNRLKILFEVFLSSFAVKIDINHYLTH